MSLDEMQLSPSTYLHGLGYNNLPSKRKLGTGVALREKAYTH